jgi:hypothetical protein
VAVVPYLSQRLLPEVEVAERGPRGRGGGSDRGEAGVGGEVVRHLVVGLSSELFREWLEVAGP